MKSTTSCRFGVTDSGAIEMSASPVARIGTLVSWLTGTISSLTPSRLAYSSASTQAGPENCGPLPVVFSGSHGNSPMAAKRSTPRSLISSMVGLLPGAGTSLPAQADAATTAANPQAAAPLMRSERRMVSLPEINVCIAGAAGSLAFTPRGNEPVAPLRRVTSLGRWRQQAPPPPPRQLPLLATPTESLGLQNNDLAYDSRRKDRDDFHAEQIGLANPIGDAGIKHLAGWC